MLTQDNVTVLRGLSPKTIIETLDVSVIEESDYFFLKQYFKDLGWKSIINLEKQTITGSDANGRKFHVEKFIDIYSYRVTRTVKLCHHHISNEKENPFYIHQGQILILENLSGSNIPGFYVATNKGDLFWSYRTLNKSGLVKQVIKYNFIWKS